MTEALGLPAGYFKDDFKEPIITLRPIRYTAEQSDVTAGIFGAGIHPPPPNQLCSENNLASSLTMGLDFLLLYSRGLCTFSKVLHLPCMELRCGQVTVI
jgi:hypothetical protein